MSFAQGTAPFNAGYFDSLDARVSVTVTCDGLQKIFTQATTSVNGTLNAVTTQLSLVQTDFNNLVNQINTLESHIATLTASQTAMTAVGTVGLTAAGISDLGSCIAYCKAQGLTLVTLGSTNTTTFIEQALALAQDLIALKVDYDKLSNQISSLEALLSAIPARLESLTNNILAKAATIPHCAIS